MPQDMTKNSMIIFSRDPAKLKEQLEEMAKFMDEQRDKVQLDIDNILALQNGDAPGREPPKHEYLEEAVKPLKALVDYYDRCAKAMRAGFVPMPDLPFETTIVYKEVEEEVDLAMTEAMAEQLDSSDLRVVRSAGPLRSGRRIGGRLNAISIGNVGEYLLPVNFCRPELVEVANRAEVTKAFDELGIYPPRGTAGGDPILVGAIRGPDRGMIFMLMAFFDLSTQVYR